MVELEGQMSFTREEIREKLGGRLVGKESMKKSVVLALQKLPDDLVLKITKEVWFISSFDDAWGFVLTGDELQGKHLIFLSDELFSEPEKQIVYTILHEVGHVILRHRNAILRPQTREETEKQESHADEFARKYL